MHENNHRINLMLDSV